MSYKVIPSKDGKGWQVLCPGGYIANQYTHKDKKDAEKVAQRLEAFYGDGRNEK